MEEDRRRRMIFAIDPGPSKSAYVVMNGDAILEYGHIENDQVLTILDRFQPEHGFEHMKVAIEWIESQGMAVGKSVFETVYWIGRYDQAVHGDAVLVPRRSVKLHLCNSMRARDANIRQAIIDRYPATGGGKNPQIGTKSQPGPLYGISNHVWAAIAVAITATETPCTT